MQIYKHDIFLMIDIIKGYKPIKKLMQPKFTLMT